MLLRLIKNADVLIHNFRPGVEDRLGLDYTSLRLINPRLVYCAISAWGERGPWARRPGIDSLIQAFGGLMSLTGEPERPLMRAGVPLVDTTTPLSATIAILAALMQRDRTNRGSRVSTSLLHQGLYMQGPMFAYAQDTGENPPRMGNRSPMAIILEGQTPTGGLLVGIPSQKFWDRFCECIERRDLAARPAFATHALRLRNQFSLAAVVEPILGSLKRESWLERLLAAGVPCAPINDYGAVLRDEQVAAIGAFMEIELPTQGRALLPNVPWRIDDEGAEVRVAPPSLGRDTAEVLAELGLTPEEIQALHDRGVTRGMYTDSQILTEP